jgi:hypothetical protein
MEMAKAKKLMKGKKIEENESESIGNGEVKTGSSKNVNVSAMKK